MSSQTPKAASFLDYQTTIDGLMCLVLACFLIVFAGIHIKNVYQDLFTAERKTLEYRAHKPKMTRSYKVVVWMTAIAICLFAWTLIFTAIQYNFSFEGLECTMAFSICEKVGFFGSRGALYLTYILRLHRVYGTSGYGWPVRNLEIIAVLLIVLMVGLFAFTTITIYLYPVYIKGPNTAFPYYCQIISDQPWVSVAGGSILLFDLVCSILSMIAFIKPLDKIRAAMKENNPQAFTDHAEKMRSIGYQYKVLVVAGSTTTLLWIALLFAQQTFLATLFINFDYWFNAIVVLFMSSYYPRDRYYERFCFLCICMCECKGHHKKSKYNSKASTRNLNPEASAALTADTSTMFAGSRIHKLLYAEVDKNNDNRVDCDELAAACNISVQQAQAIIDQHDVDGDGKLDRDEFETLKQGIFDAKEAEKEDGNANVKEDGTEEVNEKGKAAEEIKTATAVQLGVQQENYVALGDKTPVDPNETQ